jgi:plastocyanin
MRIRLGLAGVLALVADGAAAALTVQVEARGGPLPDAVASLHSEAAVAAVRAGTAEMDQREGQFLPRVLPVVVGTEVAFPNSDKVRHHVYSFSPAKRFELPLFSGRAATPVRFDRPGVATLGCNIHDWMIAYVVVLDTPYFARTADDGRAALQAPPGRYRLRVWHERLGSGRDAFEREIEIGDEDRSEAVFLDLAPPPPPRATGPALRTPAVGDGT